MVRIQTLSIAIVGAACMAIGSAITASSAQAAIIDYNFQVDATTGNLAGQSFFGSFSYDDAALSDPSIQIIDSNTGNSIINATNGLLNLSFNFLGNTYNQTSDSGYSEYPQLNFNNGSFEGLDYLVNSLVNSDPVKAFIITFDDGQPVFRAYDVVEFGPSTPRLAEGSVTYQRVPTPALLPGLIGLGIGVIRKRRTEAKEQLADS